MRTSRGDQALLAGAILLVALAGYATFDAWGRLRAAQAAVDEVRTEADVVKSRVRALSTRPASAEALAQQAVASALGPPPQIVTDLGLLLPPDVRLESLQLTYGVDVGLVISVNARSRSSYDTFLERLERSPAFAEVVLGDEDRSEGVRAMVSARYERRAQ